MAKISVVIPCYNSDGNVPVTSEVIFAAEKLYPSDTEFEYVFVDDGSKDQTLSELLKVKDKRPEQVKVIKLARNFGSNSAAVAGLHHATGDCAAILSVDLQDPPELLAKMFGYWQKNIKLVVANRERREEGLSRTLFSSIYHFIMRKLVPSAPSGGFDLVLFDRQVCDLLIQMDEKNTYIPYLLMWFGFDYVSIPYTRRKREIGQSGWSFSKKVKAAMDSVIAFSFVPIRLISISGFVFGFAAMFYLINIIYQKLIVGSSLTEGWASLMVVILSVSSFQMIALGIVGEYVWRSLDSSRKRPNFVVDEVYDSQKSFSSIKKIS